MPNMDIEEFLEKNQGKTLRELSMPLVSQLNSFCEDNGLTGLVEADFICMKCSDSEVYEARKADMESKIEYSFETTTSGRRTSLMKLKDAIPTIVGSIEYLELQDQKPDNSQDDRISCIAIVPVTLSYEEVRNQMEEKGLPVIEIARPHYTSSDIKLPSGFTVRLGQEFLVDKVKREEMI
jgi:hypothetical protein